MKRHISVYQDDNLHNLAMAMCPAVGYGHVGELHNEPLLKALSVTVPVVSGKLDTSEIQEMANKAGMRVPRGLCPIIMIGLTDSTKDCIWMGLSVKE